MQRICHPPAPSGNRTLTTQHAVQISSGSEITEHLPTSVELSAGACQLSGRASCGLMNLPFPLSSRLNGRFCAEVVSSRSYGAWTFILLHAEHENVML